MKLLIIGIFCLAAAAWAEPLVAESTRDEPQEIASSLTLEQVVEAAGRENAQLHSARAKWQAMQERPVQARTLPNPMFAYKSMDETGNYEFPNTEEKRLEVEQQFPWFGKLGLKGKIAEKDAAAMQYDYEAMQREVVMMVKEGYYDLYAVQQALSITRTDVDVLKRMEQIAETMYSTGERTQQDVLKAQSEITMLKQKVLELGQQEGLLTAKLNQLLNRQADAPLGLAVTAPSVETEPGLQRLFAIAEKARPEVKKASTDIQRSQYERDLMQKEFWPDYRLGVEYRTFRSDPDMLMFTIGFDLPIWQTKYRAGVREAERMIESSKAELDAVQKQTSFDVRDAQFKLLTARQTLELYRGQLIPQAKARYESSEAGYRTGKVDFMDLLESQRFLLSARVMAAMAEGNVGMQAARLERAIGTELPKTEEKK
jgi:outer membrane protein TolC